MLRATTIFFAFHPSLPDATTYSNPTFLKDGLKVYLGEERCTSKQKNEWVLQACATALVEIGFSIWQRDQSPKINGPMAWLQLQMTPWAGRLLLRRRRYNPFSGRLKWHLWLSHHPLLLAESVALHKSASRWSGVCRVWMLGWGVQRLPSCKRRASEGWHWCILISCVYLGCWFFIASGSISFVIWPSSSHNLHAKVQGRHCDATLLEIPSYP